jgi:chemotaxis response regulator CheB
MTRPFENNHTARDEQPNCLGPLCPIVCIGISMGGIFPLKQILKALGPEMGMAFVVIHHVSQNLPKLLLISLSQAHQYWTIRARHQFVRDGKW